MLRRSQVQPKPCKQEESMQRTELSRRKRQRKQLTQRGNDQGSVDDRTSASNQRSSQDNPDWGQRLPLLILRRIFQLAVETEGAVPFLCRAGRVCRLWRQASLHPSLWQHLNLAYKSESHLPKTKRKRVGFPSDSFKWMEQKRFSKIKSVDLGGWTKLTHAGIKDLVKHCSVQLEEISLSGCQQVNHDDVYLLARCCPKLHTLDLSNTKLFARCVDLMRCVFEAMNCRLLQLRLAGNYFCLAVPTFRNIMVNCKNLTALDISDCGASSFVVPIEEFQESCPKLQILKLSGSLMVFPNAPDIDWRASPGFPKLLELRLAFKIYNVIHGGVVVNDNILLRLCAKSHDLRLLDLARCKYVTSEGMENLPASDLQHLNICKSSLCKKEVTDIIFKKWRHSLLELDISQVQKSAVDLDASLPNLVTGDRKPVLKQLNISSNHITMAGVRSLLGGCPDLTSLDLSYCLGLPNGMKHSYHGDQLAKFKGRLAKSVQM